MVDPIAQVVDVDWLRVTAREFGVKCYWYVARDPFDDHDAWYILQCERQAKAILRAARRLLQRASREEMYIIGCGLFDLVNTSRERQSDMATLMDQCFGDAAVADILDIRYNDENVYEAYCRHADADHARIFGPSHWRPPRA